MSNSELFVAETEMKVFEFGFLQSSLKPILRPKLEIFLGGLRDQDGFQIPTASPELLVEEKEEEEATPSSQRVEISKIQDFQVEEQEEEEDGFRTPTSLEHKIITEFQNCPPAPKKPKSASKRRASDLCYSRVDSEDLESLFRPILAGFSDNSGQKFKKTRREEIQ